MTESSESASQLLVESLFRQLSQKPSKASPRLLETHISWVILAGDFAYKIKKPVNFGFLDFSTLERRHFFCEEELRLNRRLAPELYLDVLPITGALMQPQLGGSGTALDYAVRLRRFDDDALASRRADTGQLTTTQFEQLAEALAAFHESAPRAHPGDRHGDPETIQGAALHNFPAIGGAVSQPVDRAQLDDIRRWQHQQFERLRNVLVTRKAQGHVRECHGDLHLGNLVVIEGRLVPFDCIEFSEDLRWIDTQSELAFLVMDLEVRGLSELAWRFMNQYLAITGDYGGLQLLDYYRVYRAMVRAKIACLAREQATTSKQGDTYLEVCRSYLHYATDIIDRKQPGLLITHGYSGSGKSHVAQQLAMRWPAICVRSDIERKRLAGYGATSRTDADPGRGIYTEERTRATYAQLKDIAAQILQAGLSVIVDATFLQRDQRALFVNLAQDLGVRFAILDVRTSDTVLRARIMARLDAGADPSEATVEILDRQLHGAQPLMEEERRCAIDVDGDHAADLSKILETLRENPNTGC